MPSRKNLLQASSATCPDAPIPPNTICLAPDRAMAALSNGIDVARARMSIRVRIDASITFETASDVVSSSLTLRCTNTAGRLNASVMRIVNSRKPSRPTCLQKRMTVGSLVPTLAATSASVASAACRGCSSTQRATRCSARLRSGSRSSIRTNM